jgi:hypothetical protein
MADKGPAFLSFAYFLLFLAAQVQIPSQIETQLCLQLMRMLTSNIQCQTAKAETNSYNLERWTRLLWSLPKILPFSRVYVVFV